MFNNPDIFGFLTFLAFLTKKRYILLKDTTKDRKIVLVLQLAADWLGSEEEVWLVGAAGLHDGAASLGSAKVSLQSQQSGHCNTNTEVWCVRMEIPGLYDKV